LYITLPLISAAGSINAISIAAFQAFFMVPDKNEIFVMFNLA